MKIKVNISPSIQKEVETYSEADVEKTVKKLKCEICGHKYFSIKSTDKKITARCLICGLIRIFKK